MGNPSPFEIGRHVGNNFAKMREQGAIESILSESMASQDPQVFQNSISKILSQVSPERQGPALQFLQNTAKQIQQKQLQQRQQAAAQKYGIDADLPVGLQTAMFKENQKNQRFQDAQKTFEKFRTSPGEFKANEEEELLRLTGHPDREISEQAKAILKQKQKAEQENRADTRQQRKERLDFHKETQKYDEDLIKNARTAKNQIQTIDNIEKAVSSGNVKPSSLANIFKGLGNIGDKVSTALLNKDESLLLSSIPQLLEGWKEVFGVRLSDADLKLLQDKLPSIGKTPEANRAVLNILKKYADLTVLRGKIAAEIKEVNEGLRPLGYADKIEARYDEMTAPVKIINPNNGNIIEIPAYKLSDALNSGAKLANE